MNHDQLYEQAKKAIERVFSDTSVSAEQTAESLAGLRDEIDMMIETLGI